MDALHSLKATFNLDFTPVVNQYLTKFKTYPKSNPYGYKLLHNVPIPFDKAPGDGVGLFPINYLTRAMENPQSKEAPTDWMVVDRVVKEYILTWPNRISDGTFSRVEGWKGERGNLTFLWADDQFMGFTLLARVAAVKKDSDLVRFAAKQALQFADHLGDDRDDLYFHGYNAQDERQSCCKWGRANGWGMMSHIEVRK